MSFNNTTIIGNLTRDPEIKYTAGGMAICEISIAVNEKRKDREDKVNYFDVKVFGKQAESTKNYLKKGSQTCVSGRLSQERWQDKTSGQNRSKIVINADRVVFLGSKNTSQQSSQPTHHNSQPTPQQPQRNQAPSFEPPPMPEFNTEPESDIPF